MANLNDIDRYINTLRTIMTMLDENEQYGEDWQEEKQDVDDMIEFFMDYAGYETM